MEQAATSFNQGFDAGYDDALAKAVQSVTEEALNRCSDKDYKNGIYAGGEGIVDSILPELDILPEIPVHHIIQVGVAHMQPHIYRLLGASEVADHIKAALDARSPLSVVRLGDGELLTLAQEVVMNEEQVRQEGPFLNYAGVHLPDLLARDLLVQAIRHADIVGIPKLRLPNFQPLAFSTLRAHGIDYRHLRLTLSTINYSLYSAGLFRGILANQRVLIVGNTSSRLAHVLANSGIQVTGAVSPVEGIHDIPRVMEEISLHDFDIALVAAGVPAVIIVQRIASELGKVAVDFGHLADSFVNGEAGLPG